MINIISLGAGVQSSTMALMAAHGEFDVMPDAAIFCDTQAEPDEVYEWLEYLKKEITAFPVYEVTKGSLVEDSLKVKIGPKTGVPRVDVCIPAFSRLDDGRVGLMGRKCTMDYKVKAFDRKAKELFGHVKNSRLPKEAVVSSWVGISKDEAHRMKPSREQWKTNRYPLIEKDMARGHCLEWMEVKGYEAPPRSACYFCPFHDDKEWERMKRDDKKSFDMSVKFEKDLQAAVLQDKAMKGTPWLHSSCKPLSEITFDVNKSLDLFGNECEGMCGV